MATLVLAAEILFLPRVGLARYREQSLDEISLLVELSLYEMAP
jgi:hypothetical protein